MIPRRRFKKLSLREVGALLLLGICIQLGPALAIQRFATHSTEMVEQLQSCVRRQFVSQGFSVAASNITPNEGFVLGQKATGPEVTVIFHSDNSAKLLLERRSESLSLPIGDNGLRSIQTLSDAVVQNCLTARSAHSG